MLDALIGNLEDVRVGVQEMRGIIFVVIVAKNQWRNEWPSSSARSLA